MYLLAMLNGSREICHDGTYSTVVPREAKSPLDQLDEVMKSPLDGGSSGQAGMTQIKL